MENQRNGNEPPIPRRKLRWTSVLRKPLVLAVGAMVAIFALDSLTPRGYAEWLLYLIPLSLTWGARNPRSTLWVASACTALMWLGMLSSPATIRPDLPSVNLLLGCVALWLVAWLLIAARKLQDETVCGLQRRESQQQAVAELGCAALTGMPLPDLLDQAVRVVSGMLDAEYCKVLELLPGGGEFVLRAGFGWAEGTVGQARVGTGQESQAGYTLLSGKPVVVTDLDAENRFAHPALLNRHAVKGGMSVIIGSPSAPFGVLGVHTKQHRVFTQDDIQFVQSIANIIAGTHTAERTLASLQQAQTLLKRTEEISKVGSWEYDVATRRIVWTDEVYRIYGVDRREYDPNDIERDISFYAEEDQATIEEAFRRCVEAGKPYELELGFTNASGERMWIRTTGQAELKDNRIVRIFGNFSDITERRLAQKTLQMIEAENRTILESLTEGVLLLDRHGRVIRLNNAAQDLLGMTHEELTDTSLDPFQRAQCSDGTPLPFDEQPWKRAIKTGATVRDMEMGIPRADGTIVWLSAGAQPVRDDEGSTIGAVVSLFDISERKRTLEALRDSEERLRLAQKATNDVVWDWDILHDSQRWSESAAVVFGWTDIVEKPQTVSWWEDRVHPEDRQRVKAGFFGVVEDPAGTYWDDEYRFQRADGSYADVIDRGFIMRNTAGEAVRVVGAMLDITSRKRAEETIARQSAEIASYYDNAPIGLAVLDRELRFVRINERLAEMNGIPAKAHLGRTIGETVPSLEAKVREVISEIIRTGHGISDIEFSGETAAAPGELRTWREDWFPMRDDGDPIAGFMVVVQDITERKRAEAALHESEERLSLVIEGSELGYWDWNIATGEVRRNARWAEMLGYTPEELQFTVRNWIDLHHPDDRASAWQSIQDHLAGRTLAHRMEYRMRTKDGGYKWILDQARVVAYDAFGKPLRMSGTHTDITNRKEAELALRRSELKYRRLHESMTDAYVLVSMAGHIKEWNRAFQEMLAYSGDELSHMPYVSITPDKWRDCDRRIVEEQVMVRGYSDVYEKEYRRKDGTIFPVELRTFLIRDEAEQPEGMWAIVRDITERKQTENRIRESRQQARLLARRLSESEEAERKRLARELHDQVAQSISSIGVNLGYVSAKVPADVSADITAKIEQSLDMVEQTARNIRNMIAQLRPLVLDDYGLLASLEWLAEQSRQCMGISIGVFGELPEPRLERDVETAFFRIAQEALANIGKHARASQATISISRSKGQIRMTVTDDGCGFDSHSVSSAREPGHIGLISMRERAESIGGILRIASEINKGTTISVDFQEKPECH
ncbi:MAG: PAS domain S-box protein [Candidatus Hydrogenedentes bacterium]|nr:PAS domain S-box protein [Candidatus Hydrogenedentota bacterium]